MMLFAHLMKSVELTIFFEQPKVGGVWSLRCEYPKSEQNVCAIADLLRDRQVFFQAIVSDSLASFVRP